MSDTTKKVMIGEDESALRELYRTLLTQEGYDVTVAENGQKTYEALEGKHFDLLLLDILMPSMTGLELLEKLKSEGRLNVAKNIVMLTNLSDDTKVAEALKYGIRGYMVKSNYTPDVFVQEVKHYLE